MQFELMTMHFIDTFFFFFNDTATTEIYTLSLHDALPIFGERRAQGVKRRVEPLHDVGRGTGLGDVAIELEREAERLMGQEPVARTHSQPLALGRSLRGHPLDAHTSPRAHHQDGALRPPATANAP